MVASNNINKDGQTQSGQFCSWFGQSTVIVSFSFSMFSYVHSALPAARGSCGFGSRDTKREPNVYTVGLQTTVQTTVLYSRQSTVRLWNVPTQLVLHINQHPK